MITEEEKRAFAKKEEKFWDLAALTSISNIYLAIWADEGSREGKYKYAAKEAYDLADALMIERRKRLKEPSKIEGDI